MAHKTLTCTVGELDEVIDAWLEQLPSEVGGTQYLLMQAVLLSSWFNEEEQTSYVRLLCIARSV